jgi:hypothetical protein
MGFAFPVAATVTVSFVLAAVAAFSVDVVLAVALAVAFAFRGFRGLAPWRTRLRRSPKCALAVVFRQRLRDSRSTIIVLQVTFVTRPAQNTAGQYKNEQHKIQHRQSATDHHKNTPHN